MNDQQQHPPALRRRVGIEAAAWGVLTALSTALVGPLLLARDAGPLAFGIYSSGVNLFGLGAGWLGPRLATRLGGIAAATVGALLVARTIFATLPFLLLLSTDGAVSLIVAVLIIWAAGEGVALPLWTAFVAGIASPSERGSWLAWRAAIAARAAAGALLPLLALATLWSNGGSLTIAFAVAAVAGSIGLWQCRALFQMVDSPALPPARSSFRPIGAAESRFLLGVFCFWFAAALNRPVLPVHVAHALQAPTVYFAMAAAVATIAGALIQPWWGRYGAEQGAQAVLWLSGLGAGGAMLLWAIVPVYWLGIPVEAIAASCWLGHLLGLTLRALDLAEDEAQCAAIVARAHLAQGSAAALAALFAALLARQTGSTPILAASGLLCLASTGVLMGDLQPVRKPAAIRSLPRRPAPAIQFGTRLPRLNFGTGSPSQMGYHMPLASALSTPSPMPWPRGLDSASERRVRGRLPLALRRALDAGCPSCGGPGCRVCYGSGLA